MFIQRRLLISPAHAAIRVTLAIALGTVAGGQSVRADHHHDLRSIHQEFQARIRELDCWRRETLERLRCQFDRNRIELEEDLREAQRRCRPEREYHVARTLAALEQLRGQFHSQNQAVHERYNCQRRDIDTWYRLALHAASHRRIPHPSDEVIPRWLWYGR